MAVKTQKMTERESRTKGNYRIKFGHGTIAVVPEYSEFLFDKLYDRELERKANVLVYLDKPAIAADRDSTLYLSQSLALDPYFQVALATEPNADLAKYADVVITRFNPPINEEFLNELEEYDDGTRLFVNSPKSQRYFSSKRYLEDIVSLDEDIVPKTRLVSNPSELKDALRYFDEKRITELVYKPVNGFGGNGIGEFDTDGEEYAEVLFHLNHYFFANGIDFVLQEFVSDVYGDKRIHVVNGEPVGAVLRTHGDGDFRCNIKQGGSLKKTDITDRDYKIVEKIASLLEEKGVYLAGLDILYSNDSRNKKTYLGEINAVSPGCIVGADMSSGRYYAKDSVVARITSEIKEDVKALAFNRYFGLTRPEVK